MALAPDGSLYITDTANHRIRQVAPDGQRTTLTVKTQDYLATATNPAGETYGMAYTADGLLTAFTTPRGHVNHFTYDALGRLVHDLNAGGGAGRTPIPKTPAAYTNSLTSATGRTISFLVEPLPTGNRRQRNTAPDGTVQETLFTTNSEEIRTAPDGTVTLLRDGSDPRFGMQAPIPSTVTTPAGLTSTSTTVRTATLADPTNLLSLTSLTETTTVNVMPLRTPTMPPPPPGRTLFRPDASAPQYSTARGVLSAHRSPILPRSSPATMFVGA